MSTITFSANVLILLLRTKYSPLIMFQSERSSLNDVASANMPVYKITVLARVDG